MFLVELAGAFALMMLGRLFYYMGDNKKALTNSLFPEVDE